ncbi:10045_t:CDS:1, partial [Gigaspora margarita]
KYSKGQGSIYSLFDPDSSNYHLTNIQIEFLPSLTTLLQSMDVDIIKCFKAKYQKNMFNIYWINLKE